MADKRGKYNNEVPGAGGEPARRWNYSGDVRRCLITGGSDGGRREAGLIIYHPRPGPGEGERDIRAGDGVIGAGRERGGGVDACSGCDSRRRPLARHGHGAEQQEALRGEGRRHVQLVRILRRQAVGRGSHGARRAHGHRPPRLPRLHGRRRGAGPIAHAPPDHPHLRPRRRHHHTDNWPHHRGAPQPCSDGHRRHPGQDDAPALRSLRSVAAQRRHRWLRHAADGDAQLDVEGGAAERVVLRTVRHAASPGAVGVSGRAGRGPRHRRAHPRRVLRLGPQERRQHRLHAAQVRLHRRRHRRRRGAVHRSQHEPCEKPWASDLDRSVEITLGVLGGPDAGGGGRRLHVQVGVGRAGAPGRRRRRGKPATQGHAQQQQGGGGARQRYQPQHGVKVTAAQPSRRVASAPGTLKTFRTQCA